MSPTRRDVRPYLLALAALLACGVAAHSLGNRKQPPELEEQGQQAPARKDARPDPAGVRCDLTQWPRGREELAERD